MSCNLLNSLMPTIRATLSSRFMDTCCRITCMAVESLRSGLLCWHNEINLSKLDVGWKYAKKRRIASDASLPNILSVFEAVVPFPYVTLTTIIFLKALMTFWSLEAWAYSFSRFWISSRNLLFPVPGPSAKTGIACSFLFLLLVLNRFLIPLKLRSPFH